MKRREFLGSFALATAGIALVSRSGFATQAGAAKAAPIPMTVYKSPSCGCCKEWVTHAQKNGFAPKVVDMQDLTQVKKDAGVPGELESCHTVLVGSYVVEGHVPADLVHKMLKEKPAIVGLAVAGMVVGSPGMEQGNQKQPYEVTAWTKAGKTSVYARR
ncbi:MAG: DUF411 domain-containing protein [Gemmatimonadota bacterium]|nr:DUF411 domain-containing protein [Gemmatimonadota bacterium]